MSKETQIVIDALREIITNPQHEEEKIARYFSPDYQQQVDGKRLDYRGFVGHMALLKTLTSRMSLSVLAVSAMGIRCSLITMSKWIKRAASGAKLR